jgi:glycosyltransferase involved in cell wall biosynthesis
MKVCFISGTLGRGGAERQLVYMLRALKNEKVEPRVICLTRGEALEEEIKDLGVDVDWVGRSPRRAQRLLAIINNIRSRPADILQSSHFYTNIYTAAAGKLLRIPNIGAIRNDLTSEVSAHGALGNLQLRLPEHLIANSQLAVGRAVERGVSRSRVHFVRNVVAGGNAHVRAESDIGGVRILFAGRLVKQKRPELFVKLAESLTRQFPNEKLRFNMSGSGPLRPSLEAAVRESGLPRGTFSFTGDDADIDNTFRQSDMLVLTSAHEGTPNVVLEAMNHGLPVVAMRVGGVPEILSDNCGVLVDPTDFNALAGAAARLVSDRGLRHSMGGNGREYVTKNHSLAYLGTRLVEIYSKIRGNVS